MKKISTLFAVSMLTFASSSWATGTNLPEGFPKLSSSESPTWYVIKNVRSGKFATWQADNAAMQQESSISNASFFWFTEGDDPNVEHDIKIHNSGTTNVLYDFESWKDTGVNWYILDAHRTDYPGLSICKTNELGAPSQNGWAWNNAGNAGTTIGRWSGNDPSSTWVFMSLEDVVKSLLNMPELNINFSNYVGAYQDVDSKRAEIARVLENGVSKEEYMEFMKKMSTWQKNELDPSKTYAIKSAYKNFISSQPGHVKAAWGDTNKDFGWKDYDSADKSFYWSFQKVDDTPTYKLKSAKSDYYLTNVTGDFKTAAMVEGSSSTASSVGDAFSLYSLGSCQFELRNSNGALHANSHQNGSGKSGNFVTWGGGINGNSSWYLEEVSWKQPVEVSYTYKLGSSTKVVTKLQLEGDRFIVPEEIDFVECTVEDGVVTADKRTATVTCKEKLPFVVTTNVEEPVLYYWVINTTQGSAYTNPKRFSTANKNLTFVQHYSSADYDKAKQELPLNDIVNDMWYVTGNSFDGFVFHNYKGGVLSATLSNGKLTTGEAVLVDTPSDGMVKTWKLCVGQHDTNNAALNPFGITAKEGGNYANFSAASGKVVFTWGGFDKGSSMFLTAPVIEVALNKVDGVSYSTMCLPYDFSVASTDVNTKVYKASSVSSHVMRCESVEGVSAGEGVIIKNDNEAETATLVVKKAEKMVGNLLKGTTVEIPFESLSDKLIFGRSEGVVGFFKAGGSEGLGANKAYLPLDQAKSNKLSLDFGDGETTGIFELETESNTSSAIYDMSGRRVNTIQKGGIYIQNGKKIIVK